MTTVVALLRAVNVIGHQKIKMDELRQAITEAGFADVRTYIQSGNIVCGSRTKNPSKIASQIADAIEARFGFRTDVMVRTTAELRAVVEANPFAERTDVEPAKLAVIFLAADPGEAARQEVRGMKFDPEEVHVHSRELYICFPNGMGRSKLNGARLERKLRTAGTARNWNSVNKLLAMAEEAG